MAGEIPRVDPGAISDSAFKRALFAFALTRAGTWYSSQLGARVDPWLLRVSGGRVDHAFGQIPIVLVSVRGARSGVERTVPLLYFTDGDDVILMASNYGGARHPSWYHNLLAHPECELHLGPRGGSFLARETDGAERDRLYALAVDLYSGYAKYAQQTDGIRTIRVLRLTPR